MFYFAFLSFLQIIIRQCEQRRLCSDCADAQADLSRHCLHLLYGTFSEGADQVTVPAIKERFQSNNLDP